MLRSSPYGGALMGPVEESSFKDRFRDRNSKILDLEHKFTKNSLWINGRNTSSQAQNLLRLLTREGEQEEGQQVEQEPFCAVTKKRKKMHNQTQEEMKSKNWKTQEGTGRYFVALLKICAQKKDITRGRGLHDEVSRRGLLETDVFVGSALINMYAKCGLPAKAQEVFDKLPVRDIVSWNALIAGYAQHGCMEEALNCFEQMSLEGLSPNAVTFVCSLKACASIGAIDKGMEIHAEIARKGLLERNVFVGNALVDLYAKCGLLAKAQEVFDNLPVRDVVSWTALIAGYTEHGHSEEALNCLEQMQLEGLSPNAVTFVWSLKACASIGAIDRGQEIHAEIAREGLLELNVIVANALLDMYIKCGLLAKAQEVFDKLPFRETVLWNALIAGYAEHGLGDEALNCYEQMQLEGITPDAVTFVCSLKACGSIGATDKGREIHADIVRKGLLQKNVFVGTALVDMYAKCGSLSIAQEVFDMLPVRDVVSWNALITGYTEHGYGEEALYCFEQMQLKGISPDTVTFVCSLKACGSIGATDKGQEIHAKIAKKGFLGSDLVGNALVDMYGKCGSLAKAQKVFDALPVRDVTSWNALIEGYTQHGHAEEALNCFEQMKLEGISPNAVTFVCSLKACASIGAMDRGLEIHAEIARRGLLERDLVIGNVLVEMYVKCGSLSKAQEVFGKLLIRDIVSWNALIVGYAQHGCGEEALNCFEQMQLEGISPNAVTFACSLKACACIGALDRGQKLHAEIARKKALERDLVVGNALVDMYAKCGLLAKAHEVFDKLTIRDVVSWNSLIAGYTQLGEAENVFYTFVKMVGEDIQPDQVTFLSVLVACSHAGLVDKGQMYFESMSKDYDIISTVEHHTGMVNLLGRAGQLDKAVEMIKKMAFQADLVMWLTLLGACQKWGNVKLGIEAFEHAVQLDIKDPAAYVYISNIYSGSGIEKDGNKVEDMRVEKQAWKKPEHCW